MKRSKIYFLVLLVIIFLIAGCSPEPIIESSNNIDTEIYQNDKILLNPITNTSIEPSTCYQSYSLTNDLDNDKIIDTNDTFIVVDENENENSEFHRTDENLNGNPEYLFIDINDNKKPECQWINLNDNKIPTYFVADFNEDGTMEIKWIDEDGDGNAEYFEEDRDGNYIIDYVWEDKNDDGNPEREFNWKVGLDIKEPVNAGPYSWHYNVSFPWFHVGDGGESANAWDNYWEYHFGGTDTPYQRNPNNIYWPEDFIPQENPFYTASLYNDIEGTRRSDAKTLPWAWDAPEFVSLMKNRWVEVKYNNKSCFAQIQDTGPYFSYDNMFKEGTNDYDGFDLSPSMFYCLGVPLNEGRFKGNWRFVDDKDVPEGPWKEIITTSQICWEADKDECE